MTSPTLGSKLGEEDLSPPGNVSAVGGVRDGEISSLTPTAELPALPRDPWDATVTQSFAAELRIGRALSAGKNPRRRDVQQLLHEYGLVQMSAELCGLVREASNRTLGGNCSFADDDLAILEHLAGRAIAAGLTDSLAPDVRRNAERALAEKTAAADTSEASDKVPGRTKMKPLISKEDIDEG